MNVREEIARLTPGARRYARALAVADAEERGEIADQIVQEAIVRALRADWSGRHSNLRVALYVTISALNRARLRARSSARASSGEEASTARSSPAPALRGAGVTQALDRLGYEEREALLLTAVEEFNYTQVCEILNVPRPTLIARLARARRGLAEEIDPVHAQDRSRRPQPPHLRVVK
jgi:RNA polymerase sigma-70 factor, ECF subfamily